MNYKHPKRKTKVVFVQLGSPSEPTTKALRKYLREFLGDPRVVDINPWLWKIILNFFVLPFRPKKSAKLYARIWDGKSFPLITNTRDFTKNVSEELKKIESKLTSNVLKVFDLKNSVNSKKSYGGTSFDNIKKMIIKYKKQK